MAGATNLKKPGIYGPIPVWLEDSNENSKANELLSALNNALSQSPTDPILVSLGRATATVLFQALTDALFNGGSGQSPTDIPVWLDVATAAVLRHALKAALQNGGSGQSPIDPISVSLERETAKFLLSALAVALSKLY